MSQPVGAVTGRGADAPAGAGPCAGPPPGLCAGVGEDITWLLQRSAQRLRTELDAAARAQGLADGRDWAVLASLQADPGRTQLALAADLGLDKTTLTALLDRLERAGLVVRRVDPHDRRVRIPEVTASGQEVQGRVAAGREETEARVLAGFSADEQQLLRGLLTRLAAGSGGGTC